MHSLFRRSQTIRTNNARRQRPTWEERARAALAAAREVEESSGESVPTRPSEVNMSRRLCYGPRYILPGSQSDSDNSKTEGKIEQLPHQREEPCDVLQSNMSLDVGSLQMSSVMVEAAADSPDAVTQSPFTTLSFVVSTLVPLTVNLYWLATEEWEFEESSSNFYPKFVSRVGISRSYSLDVGSNQRFALPRTDWLEPATEPFQTLLSSDWQARNSVPPAITAKTTAIAPATPLDVTPYPRTPADGNEVTASLAATPVGNGMEMEPGILQPHVPSHSSSENEIQELDRFNAYKASAYGLVIELVERRSRAEDVFNSQISFIEFYKEGNATVIPRCIKQKVCIHGVLYLQHEIFGLGEAMQSQHVMRSDDTIQCAICLSDDRDTVLLPCRHMCMCRECANTYRQQSNKCPICRTVVETILHIQSAE
ncbi:hypothetical protein GGI05_001412 [Coemansia sp. RSA 2603]|nr:hypothetical protein GGI05_001412 [Coemansia sp. RSA 2603]